jgi:glutathione S-transferase
MTVVDVLFYCEIANILSLTLKAEENLSQNNPHINDWYQRIKALPSIQALDKELASIVQKFDLAEK